LSQLTSTVGWRNSVAAMLLDMRKSAAMGGNGADKLFGLPTAAREQNGGDSRREGHRLGCHEGRSSAD